MTFDPYLRVIPATHVGDYIEFVFTDQHYLYLYDCLERACYKRAYAREYMREHRNSDRVLPISQPAVLVYLTDSEVLPPSTTYVQVKAETKGPNNIILRLSSRQAEYVQEALEKKYRSRMYAWAKAKKTRPNAKPRDLLSLLVKIDTK